MAATKKQIQAAWRELNALWNVLDRAKARGLVYKDLWDAWDQAWGPVCILRAIPKASYRPGEAEQALVLAGIALGKARKAGLDWSLYL